MRGEPNGEFSREVRRFSREVKRFSREVRRFSRPVRRFADYWCWTRDFVTWRDTAEKDGLELIHARVGEQQRWVVVGYDGARSPEGVGLRVEVMGMWEDRRGERRLGTLDSKKEMKPARMALPAWGQRTVEKRGRAREWWGRGDIFASGGGRTGDVDGGQPDTSSEDMTDEDCCLKEQLPTVSCMASLSNRGMRSGRKVSW